MTYTTVYQPSTFYQRGIPDAAYEEESENDFKEEDYEEEEPVTITFKFFVKDDDLYIRSIDLFNGEIKTEGNKIDKLSLNLHNTQGVTVATCNIENKLITINKDDNTFICTNDLTPVSFSAIADGYITGTYKDGNLHIYTKEFEEGTKEIYTYNGNILSSKIITYPYSPYVHTLIKCDEEGLYLPDIETFEKGKYKKF